MLARIYHDRGDVDTAIHHLKSAVDAARQSTIHRPARTGWTSYAWLFFYREDLGSHLLPQLTLITVTDEVAEWMLELGKWYEEVGDRSAAMRVYREILAEVPDCEIARERLVRLEK